MEGMPKRLSRGIAARPAAVLLAIGALSVGVAACGSDSSSDTTGSAASVVNKEAGYRSVKLTVVNALPPADSSFQYGNLFHVCFTVPNQGCSTATRGGSGVTTSEYPEVKGSLEYCCNDKVFNIRAKNPDAGEPYIELTAVGSVKNNVIASDSWSLGEGTDTEVTFAGSTFVLSRANDTDYEKVLTLTAKGYPGQFS